MKNSAMGLIVDLAGLAIEAIPDAVAKIRGLHKQIGALQDKLTARDRVWLTRDQVVILGHPCPGCGKTSDELNDFCPHCGHSLPTPGWFQLNRKQDRFCPFCHAQENFCLPNCVRNTHRR